MTGKIIDFGAAKFEQRNGRKPSVTSADLKPVSRSRWATEFFEAVFGRNGLAELKAAERVENGFPCDSEPEGA